MPVLKSDRTKFDPVLKRLAALGINQDIVDNVVNVMSEELLRAYDKIDGLEKELSQEQFKVKRLMGKLQRDGEK